MSFVRQYPATRFIVLDPDPGDAENLLNTLRREIYQQAYPHGQSLTVSIGVTAYEAGAALKRLLDAADQALHRAKEQGRNRVLVYAGPKNPLRETGP